MVKEGGRLKPLLSLEEDEFCLERKGDGDGGVEELEGVGGECELLEHEIPNSFLALKITV
jgi:hypothetical protein